MATRFIDSANFATASAVWDSAAKTNKAPDGWYSYCGIARQQSSGVLGPVFVCGTTADNCAVRCADTVIGGYPGTQTLLAAGTALAAGMYRRKITRSSGKAAFRVEINTSTALSTVFPSGPFGVQIQQTPVLNGSANPNQYPTRGISCKNMSPAYFATAPAVTGPIQERIFGAVNGGYVSGSQVLTEYVYNESTDTFNSRTNTIRGALGNNRLVLAGGNPFRSVFYMTPSGGDDIDLILWNPIAQTIGADTTINVFCGNTLREFTAYFSGPVKPPGCVIGTLTQSNIFMGNVQNALGGAIGLYDWAFSDFMASGVKADGYYYLPPQAGLPNPALNASIVVTNGIITELNNPCV